MKETIMNEIKQSMLRVLDNSQMMLLDKTLQRCFSGVSIILESETNDILIFEYTNIQFIDMFISAKEIEGCSKKTLNYYRRDLNKALSSNTHVTQINTEYLRN